MKMFLISLIVLVAATSKAEKGIWFDGAGAPVVAHLNLSDITRNMTLVNPLFHSPTSAQINFNAKTLELTVNRSMPPCAPNMMCIQVMPAPLNIKLDVVQVVQSGCSVKYIAQTPANVKTTVFEEVTIEDFTNSKCEMVLSNMGSVIYKATGISSLSKQPETATARFTVQGDFIRAVN